MIENTLDGKSCIYGLFDPAEQSIRYVGQSSKPRARLSQYANLCGRNHPITATKWLTEIILQGRRPCMFIFDVCQIEIAAVAEYFWYQQMIFSGARILNNPAHIRPAIARGSKRWINEYLAYAPFSVLEPGYHHRLYLPSEAEYNEKFSVVSDFVRSVVAR